MVQVLEKEGIEHLFDEYLIIIPEKQEKQEKKIKKKKSLLSKKKDKKVVYNKENISINAIKAKTYSNLYQNRLRMY